MHINYYIIIYLGLKILCLILVKQGEGCIIYNQKVLSVFLISTDKRVDFLSEISDIKECLSFCVFQEIAI